jgi:hypothetical protein
MEARRIASRMWHLRLTPRMGEETDRNSAAQHISRCSAFAALDSEVREELVAAVLWQTGRRGQTLVAENATGLLLGW